MKHLSVLLLLLLCAPPCFSQLSNEGMARGLGFDDDNAFLRARQFCLEAYSKQILDPKGIIACGSNTQCLQRALQERKDQEALVRNSTEWRLNKCDVITSAYLGSAAKENQRPAFEVIAAARSCKYFVAEQTLNYALVEDWMCPRPKRGDIGNGHLNSNGMKEVNFSGIPCTVNIHDWLLSKSQALEKFAEKCD